MKVAVMLVGDSISPHFGGSEKVCIYTVEENQIIARDYFDMPEHKAGLYAKVLKEKGTDIVIAGSMGERARYIFDNLGIKYFIGVLGDPEKAILELINGKLRSNIEVSQKIHEQEEKMHHHSHKHHHN